MTFNSQQIADLSAPLSKDAVKKNPKGFDYVEAWHAIAEANRIFGFDAWSRETVEMRLLGEPRLVGDNWRVGYFAKVRIRVYSTLPDGSMDSISREGCGFGQGINRDVDLAHEGALKEAESDAMKRALMTFGNPFGLALYDKTKANVADTSGPPETPANSFGRLTSAEAKRRKEDEKIKAEIQGLDKPGLGNWMARFSENTAHLPFAWLDSIRDFAEGHLADLDKPPEAEAMDDAFRGTMGPPSRAPVARNGSPVAAQ